MGGKLCGVSRRGGGELEMRGIDWACWIKGGNIDC
jgi:hypothetical protein